MIVESHFFLEDQWEKKKKYPHLWDNCPVRSAHSFLNIQLVFTNSHQVKQASPKEQQSERGKEDKKEIEDFCESLSPKVESVHCLGMKQ